MGVAITRVTDAVVQGCTSYYVSSVLTSLQRPYEQVQCYHLLFKLYEQVHGEIVRTQGQ